MWRKYFWDWILLLIPILLIIYGEIADPFDRFLFSGDSVSILHGFPHLEHTISIETLIFVCLATNASIAMFSARNIHHSLLGCLTGILYSEAFSNILKIVIGKFRPDFMQRCAEIELNLKECLLSKNRKIRDGRLSFPSGHTAVAFCFGVYQFCYLIGKFGLFVHNKRHKIPITLKGLICISPLIFSFWVMVTRLRDYHHSFEDILAGILIGSMNGFWSYFVYFPSLFAQDSHIPRVHYLESEKGKNN
jgi:diacylglycerol diphosphate phosphatase / phosphatidate phosphatase